MPPSASIRSSPKVMNNPSGMIPSESTTARTADGKNELTGLGNLRQSGPNFLGDLLSGSLWNGRKLNERQGIEDVGPNSQVQNSPADSNAHLSVNAETNKVEYMDPDSGKYKTEENIISVQKNADDSITVVTKNGPVNFDKFNVKDLTTGQNVDMTGKVIVETPDIEKLLDTKLAQTMDELKAQLTQKVGPESTWDKVCLYLNRAAIVSLGLGVAAGVIGGIILLSQYIKNKEKESEEVNNAIYKVTEIQTSSLKYTCPTATTRLCAGDSLSQFAGFDSVNKPELNTETFSLTKTATGHITEHTFETVKSGEIVKKGTTEGSPDLTFRVNTDAIRRVSCDVGQIVYSLTSGAAGVASSAAGGLFDGLGINWGIVILVLIGLVVGGVILAVVMK